MRTKEQIGALLSVALVVVGGDGLREPPGLLGFLAPNCSPIGACTSTIFPLFVSLVLLGIGLLLGLLVVVLVAQRRLS